MILQVFLASPVNSPEIVNEIRRFTSWVVGNDLVFFIG